MVALLHALIGVIALLSHTCLARSIIIPTSNPQQPLGAVQPSPRSLSGRFLHISDFHPDENYKPYTSTADDIACHRGHGSAGYYGAETTGCDTPLSLVNATLDWIAVNVRDEIDFVVWTGDSARHDSDEDVPRHAEEVLRTNRWMADRVAETFSNGRDGQLAIPVVPSMGNNDFLPHNIFYPGPNRWLTRYLDVWRYFIPAEQHHSFQFGGWFSVEVVPNKLAVFSLNTMYFFARNAGVDGCADPDQPGYQHLEWLRIHLQLLRGRGMKAILIGHVPPARTENKQLWDESCWQKYTLWLRQFRDVVTASLYGHMNIDHFIVADSKDIGHDLGGRHDVREEIDFGSESSDQDLDEALAAELSIKSKGTYLADLRDIWSKLPRKISPKEVVSARQPHAHGGKWGERYSLAIVNPSIVPNYLPTLRIYEYNITGLEDTPTWQDDPEKSAVLKRANDANLYNKEEITSQDLKKREVESLDGKKKKKKKKKPHRPHDPELIIPSPPSPTAEPGPAYSPQPLTLTGYTQWFANLTRLNNMPPEGLDDNNTPPEHLPFEFEIEYDTFADKWYKVPDLTVRSYVRLASRIARRYARGSESVEYVGTEECRVFESDAPDNEDDDDVLEDYDGEDDDELLDDDGLANSVKHHQIGKKKHKGKKSNKVWLKFLQRAFIGTVSREDLEQWDD